MKNTKKLILKKISKSNLIILILSILTLAIALIIIDFYSYKSYLNFLKGYSDSNFESKLSKHGNSLKSYSEDYINSFDHELGIMLKNKTSQGYDIANAIYNQQKGVNSKEKIISLIATSLKSIRFFNKRGYFFIIDLKGNCIHHPIFPEMEGTNLCHFENIADQLTFLKDNQEGIVKGVWYKPGRDKRLYTKWSYIKKFEELDLYIGTGEYYYDYLSEKKNKLLSDLAKLNYSDDGFYYVIDISKGSFVMENGEILTNNINVYSTAKTTDEQLFEAAIKAIQKDGSGMHHIHVSRDSENELSEAITFVTKIEGLNWILATGVYKDEAERYLNSERNHFLKRLRNNIIVIVTLIVIFILASIFFTNKLVAVLKLNFEKFQDFFENAHITGTIMDLNEVHYDEFVTIAKAANLMITERNIATKKLKKDKEFIDQLLEENPEPIAMTTNTGKILKINTAFTSVFGYKIDEVLHKDIEHLLCDNSELLKARQQTEKVSSGKSVKFLGVRIAKNGRQMNMHISGIPVIFNGEIQAVFAIYQDRTSQIEHDKELRIATDKAIESAQIKAQFLATMSHEIRTPMNGVIGTTDLLTSTPLNNEQLEYVATIKSSGESLLRVINDILDFSKIESGKIEFQEKKLSLSKCVEDTFDLIAMKNKKTNLELFYEISPNIPDIFVADFSRIKQVLLNLLNNSFKFTEKGYIKLHIRGLEENNDKIKLLFRIEDTGIGIPDDKIALIFNSFTQVDSSASRKFAGTGLGLAICKAIITNMHGDIWINSELNKGSNFFFTISVKKIKETLMSKKVKSKLINKNIGVIGSTMQIEHISGRINDSVKSLTSIDSLSDFSVINGMDAIIVDDTAIQTESFITDYLYSEANKDRPPLLLLKNINTNSVIYDKAVVKYSWISKPLHKAKLDLLLCYLLGITTDSKVKVIQNNVEPTVTKIDILVAEDNVINQKLVIRMFSKLGFDVDLATDGIEAIEMSSTHKYDIILMDLQMPRMGGLEATKEIITRDGDCCPVIIALTANVLNEDKERCLNAGMKYFLPKPIKIVDLQSIITKFETNNY
ncbi:MAG: hypothetical protein B6226_05890 [Candidatus Cloacimonetes bacterium 4572_65]|nr:MAG: hypothetical protein B6226_05890 [Candidatus Cloacimonetes bacterium 4572_65]